VGEDLADDRPIFGECDDAHRALALGAFERIDFVDFVDEARPGRAHARGFANIDFHRSDHGFLRAGEPALSAATVRVPAGVAHQVLKAVRNVAAQLRKPICAGHDLEVALERPVHARAVDDDAGDGLVGHLLQREGRPQHVLGEPAPAGRVARMYANAVMH